MNAEQYRQLRDNRRVRGPVRLGEPPRGRPDAQTPLAAVLARAARRQRRCAAAEGAWLRVAASAWSDQAAVETVEGDTVVIAVRNSVVLYELERRRGVLERRMAELVPGVRRLRFAIAGR